MNSFSQKASIILMTILFMVAVLRLTTFSNFEEDEIEEATENVADCDVIENLYFLQWSFNQVELKLQTIEENEFKIALKNRLVYLNPLIDKILMPPERLA